MKPSAIIAAVLLFGVIGASGAGLMITKRVQEQNAIKNQPHFEPMAFVQVVTAKTIPFQPTSELTGTVFSRRTVRVQNEVSGTIRKVNFQSGDVVDAGQVLVVIDDSTDVADMHAAEASVRVKQADLKVVDARIALAQAEYKRQQEANTVAATSAMEVDRAKAELDKATADRLRSQAEIEEAQAKVEQMRVRLDKFTLKAPFKGRVGMRTVHEGQFLPPQMGMGGDSGAVAVLEEVADTIYLDFAIPQEYMPRVRVGLTVVGTSPLFGDKPVTLKVVAIDASASMETRNVRVRSEVDNRDGMLRPGMSLQIRVPIDLPVKYTAVPVTAIQRSSSGESLFVAVKDKDGLKSQQRIVKLGPVLADPDSADPSAPAPDGSPSLTVWRPVSRLLLSVRSSSRACPA
ncbi:MAG: efflux RND transporter periplasmic adaptor subunit [Phycisphaerales bacterium]